MSTRGIGILSWKGYDSLRAMLTRLNQSGVPKLFDEHLIFFPEIDDEARAIATEFGFACAGSPDNLGIFGGFRALAETMTSDTILLLENDLHVKTSDEEAARQLQIGFALIEQDRAKVVCLRHTREPGDFEGTYKKFRRYFPEAEAPYATRLKGQLLQTVRPDKVRRLLGHAPFVMERPEEHFSEFTRDPDTGFWLISSAYRNWSNLAVMVDRRFYTEVLMTYVDKAKTQRRINGFKNIEVELNGRWWRKKNWTIAIAPGIFSHHRIGGRGY